MIKKVSKRWWVIGSVSAAAIALTWWLFGSRDAALTEVPTFTVQKGNLQINVLQGGEIRALKNFEVKSEIEYPTKIMSLIPEGYLITEEDVKDGKVLVELDPSDIKDKITTHDIEFQTTVANYIDVDENREIVRSENQSLVRDAKTAATFALMDFEKYLGNKVAGKVLKERGLPETVDVLDQHVATMEASAKNTLSKMPATDSKASSQSTKDAKPAAPAPKVASTTPPVTAPGARKPLPVQPRTDFIKFLDSDDSNDGEADQKLGQLKGDLLLHQSELSLAQQTTEASVKLAEKNFITKSALENDQVTLAKVKLTVKTAEVALDLFRRYEFPKMCEQLIGAYQDALHKLQRIIRENRSRMAQAESKFETAKRRYEMELAKKEDLERQLKACVIRALQPGLVAYGAISSGSSNRYSEAIEEGAAVRLRQTILTIPNMEAMGVHVSVHESQVKKVRIGQRVRVRVDAEPGKELFGQVAEVAVLPDSTSSRYTPNLKVYPCSVHIDGVNEWLKPGMNAKVDIIVNDLADVMYVPVQSIEVENDHHYCYVNTGSELVRREINTGAFNDEFIEVVEGLKLGEIVSLTVPKRSSLDNDTEPAPASPTKDGDKAKKAVAAR